MEWPVLFVNRLFVLLGEGANEVLAALDQEPVVSLRLNPLKYRKITDGLLAESVTLPGEKVPWATNGFYLDERKAFTFDPLFHAGCYYVQEASSMFLEQVVRQYVSESVKVLDLCAAPGGKSTLLRSVLPEGSLLVSNEVIPARARVLVENIVKWGHPDSVVTSSAPADFGTMSSFFDIVIADVPCSGEGMFRKDPVAVTEWSEANVETCWRRSRGIISDCWDSLKEGGLLVYSTCTFNTLEDEENVRWICDELGAEVLPLEISSEWGITGSLLSSEHFPVYRFLPGRTRGEGFFLAVLRKLSSPRSQMGGKTKARFTQKTQPVPQVCKGWICESDFFVWEAENNAVNAISEQHVAAFSALTQHVHVLHGGINVAELKGRDVIPSPSLALSSTLRGGSFPVIEVSYSDALTYLRKESLSFSPETPRGYILLSFRGVPLGFAKNVGNRANNLYPSEWRIRTTHFPEGEVRVI
ncbi:MAG: rRNA cytosine-C5-methyltransferase [Bacteroidaceae bacterium]|nr:rRNA cytosine-C5-methyltransferase [Bacteroidaceae bacterium]